MSEDIQAVLFDLDGTLIDTHDLILDSMRYATTQVLGATLPDEKLMAKVGQPLAVQMADFTSNDAQQEEILRVYRAHNETLHDSRVSAFPQVKEAVSELCAAGFPVAVVTSKRHALAVRGLSLCNLLDMMTCVIGSDDWPTYKPDPGPILHGCDCVGVAPSHCLYVGDSPFDIQAGRRAGCFTAAALWGMFKPEVLAHENPHFQLSSIEEVLSLVQGEIF